MKADTLRAMRDGRQLKMSQRSEWNQLHHNTRGLATLYSIREAQNLVSSRLGQAELDV
jgi:hypothetical protein